MRELADIVHYINATYVDLDEASTNQANRMSAEPVDQVLSLNPLGGELRFEQEDLTVAAGSRVRLVFNNTSSHEHNFVLVDSAEISDDVVTASFAAGDRGFVPEHEDIIAAIPVVSPGGSGEVEFVVPKTGKYRFVCLLPGHNFTMKGTLNTVK